MGCTTLSCRKAAPEDWLEEIHLKIRCSRGHITSNSFPLCDWSHVCITHQNCKEGERRNGTGVGFALWEAHISSCVAVRSFINKSELLEQLHKPADSWRSNGTVRMGQNQNVYRFSLLLKHRSQKQMTCLLLLSQFPLYRNSLHLPLGIMHLPHKLISILFSCLCFLTSEVLILIPQQWHIPKLSVCSCHPLVVSLEVIPRTHTFQPSLQASFATRIVSSLNLWPLSLDISSLGFFLLHFLEKIH